MKNLIFTILSLIPILVLGQSQDQNWVKSTTYKKPSTSTIIDVNNPAHVTVQVSYFDGLGRPIQQIAHQQSNTGKDIVTHIAYDEFGRQTRDFLPFISSTAPSLDIKQNEVMSFYGTNNIALTANANFETTTNPFSERELEASPLGRVFKQAAPGNTWVMGSGKEIKFDYQNNETNDKVKFFQATATWNLSFKIFDILIQDNGYFNANELYKSIIKDENWTSGKNNTTEEYKNKEGQVVLKRSFNINNKGLTEPHDTYYIYDQFGNLTYVIPPLANGDVSQTTLDNLGYQYKYDSRNRLVEKKLPGKQWEFIVYDKLDRPVATGPAFTPYGGATIGWMITQYDTFGRVTQTGWKQMRVSSNHRTGNQNSINVGSNPFVLSANDILTKNYYDNYDFLSVALPTQVEGQYTVTTASKLKGLLTGSWTKVLDSNAPNASETSYTLYDDRYRPIRSHTDTYLGGFTEVDSKLDWAGKTAYTITKHKYDTNGSTTTITDRFSYSAQDRLTLHKQQINSLPEQLITKNTYDELGQLISKKVGGEDLSPTTNGLQKVDYTYNIRGWLKAINDVNNIGTDLFAFKISYENPTDATKALFNGNIAETYWKTSTDNTLRKYEYTYDGLNRLLNANYSKVGQTTAPNDYKEALTYDKNGNIQTLNRFGTVNDPGYSPNIDNLVYTYDATIKNQLVKVDDSSNSSQGFKDGINTDNDFFYDANGNMTQDKNKEITNIVYNHLNLPTEIVFNNDVNKKITYIYNATGTKLEKRVTSTPEATWTNPFPTPVTNKTTYLAGFQYKDNKLEFFPHAEGYVKYDKNQYSYVFNYTDHLGNIRVSYSDIDKNGILGNEYIQECPKQIGPTPPPCQDLYVSAILEENHYYPFGLKHEGYNSNVNSTNSLLKYKFNGQEWQNELGLNVTAMDYRQYDNALGRFNSIDVMAEFFPDASPYAFGFNNPLYFIDPTGLCPECEENVKDPTEGSRYTSTGGGVYLYENGQWTREDGQLDEVVVTGNSPKTSEESTEESTESVGQPGTMESMIPIWGSGRSAVDHFQKGNYWQGALYTGLAISDVFLVKALITGVAKGGLIAMTKNYSSWGGTGWRRFYGTKGFAQPGQHLHHWLLRRNGQKTGTGLAWKFKNQMWNLMPMKSPAFHTSVHGNGANAFNTLQQAYYGSPIWFKTAITSTIGHSLMLRNIETENTTDNEGTNDEE